VEGCWGRVRRGFMGWMMDPEKSWGIPAQVFPVLRLAASTALVLGICETCNRRYLAGRPCIFVSQFPSVSRQLSYSSLLFMREREKGKWWTYPFLEGSPLSLHPPSLPSSLSDQSCSQ
jgi:hypothetical protein